MEEGEEAQETTQARGSRDPAPPAASGACGPGEPVQLTPAELFVSKQPGAVAVRAMFQELPPKMEDSDEGFHDPRDDVDPEPGLPAAEAPAEEYQLPLREELQQRAAEAVAAAKESSAPHTFDQDVDFGNGEDSDL
eukprot:115892-Amphidinium_carterae.1